MADLTRREFIAASAAATGCVLAGAVSGAEFSTTLKKSLIMGKPSNADGLKKMKDAGFHGIECSTWNAKPDDAKKAREIAEGAGMRIHSVLRGWANFNNPGKVEGDIASVETALKTAAGYGAHAVLFVPCRIGVKPTPQPWEFDIKFDEKTGLVSEVVKGDNEKFGDYIKAQNQATEMSIKALKKLAPVAEKLKVKIAVENVWNNLWVKPDLAVNLIKLVDSPWVRVLLRHRKPR